MFISVTILSVQNCIQQITTFLFSTLKLRCVDMQGVFCTVSPPAAATTPLPVPPGHHRTHYTHYTHYSHYSPLYHYTDLE